ncbi:MAG TPA: hypothetical protein PKV59_04220, partial [Flexilinea sp.]|nr:hypothetical protein [Flexilinea sp.]
MRKYAGLIKIILLVWVIGSLSACTLPSESQIVSTPYDPVSDLVKTIQSMSSRTPYPTGTPYPTHTPYPTYSPEEIATFYARNIPAVTPTVRILRETAGQNVILVNPGLWSRDLSKYAFCEDRFAVKIGYRQPYFAYAVGNEVSKSQFLLVNLMVWNISDSTIPLIFHKQFKAVGTYRGEKAEYISYGPAGISASNRWGVPFLSSQAIPPGVEMETWLGFDVNPHATDWKLVFEADDSSDFSCRFSLDMPQPEFS